VSASSQEHTVAGFLLVGANLRIDFAEAEIAVLSIASVALAPVYVAGEVPREVPDIAPSRRFSAVFRLHRLASCTKPNPE
jgi:hypothetical protein